MIEVLLILCDPKHALPSLRYNLPISKLDVAISPESSPTLLCHHTFQEFKS